MQAVYAPEVQAFLAARNDSCRADAEYLRSVLPDQG
jgi:hypothetical protein